MIGSLFSGYGGLDLAVESVLGLPTAFVADIDAGACRILAHRRPGVPNLGDVAGIDWSPWRGLISVLTGGFPCQDVSKSGRRRGLVPGETRTGLWAEMLRAIDELRPDLVLAENVRGLLSGKAASDMEPCSGCVGDGDAEPALRAHGAVLADLACIGYDAAWVCLTAAQVGAPHERQRVFILAWPTAADPDSIEERDIRRGARQQASEERRRRPADDSAPGPGSRLPAARPAPPGVDRDAWGEYAAAVEHWQRITGHPAPHPRDAGRVAEWLMGLEPGWLTDVPGLSHSAVMKAAGNGVVPQQAAEALRRLLTVAPPMKGLTP